MPQEASSLRLLTISGSASRVGRLILRRFGKHREGRHRNPVVVDQRLGQVLAARQHQAARIAAGIGNAHQLEIAHDVLIVDDLALKLLEQAEHHIGFPAVDLFADRLELVVHAKRTNVMPGGTQRADDVVLGLPDIDFLLAVPLA